MNISSEEELQDYFHSVHSFIRNRFGLYGKAALQFFNFFFVLKVIEPFIESGQINFNKGLSQDDEEWLDCRYSKLTDIIDENEKIDHIKRLKNKIYNSEHKNTFFMNFPIDRFDVKKTNLSEFINKLNILTPDTMDQYHVYGRVYEYFLGHITGRNSGSRSGSQMEDLGQFFTSRHLVRYCIAKVGPTLKPDKVVPKMGDFYCGSGGFITEYIRYLNHKYLDIIKWDHNIHNIFGFDTDSEILKSARVDIITLTKSFFSQNSDDDTDSVNTFSNNFRNINTFEETCEDTNGNLIRVDFNFTNPPYGNSGKTTEEDKLKLSSSGKDIKHVAKYGSILNTTYPNKYKPTKNKPYLINGDNKETLSMLHGMGVLAPGGTYCGVLKEGCFFDKKFQDLRTNLCKFYEVKYVISVPQDDFLNTSTKTSILIFKNSGKQTTEIKFCELDIIKSDNKIIGFKEINSQTKQTINSFCSANYEFVQNEGDYLTVPFDELEKNNFSFNFKNYIKEDIKVGSGFKVVRLGDICEINPGCKKNSEYGIYEYVEIGDVSENKIITSTKLTTDKIPSGSKRKPEIGDILICSVRPKSQTLVYYTEEKDNLIVSGAIFVARFKDHNLGIYVYYYFINNLDEKLKQMGNGSSYPRISPDVLADFQIPIPESIETVKLYLDYLGPANQTLQTLQTLQTQKEASICGKIKLLTMMGTEGVDYDEYKLGDIITTKPGKFNTKNMTNTGEYPFYNASINNPIGTHNEYCFDGEKYLLFIKSGNVNANSIGSVLLCYNKIASVPDMIKIDSKQNIDYLCYYLTVNKYIIKSFAHTSTGLGHIDMSELRNLKIRILKPHLISQYKLDDDFIFMDKLRNDISNTLKLQEETTRQMMSLVLSSNHMNNKSNKINTDTDTNTESEQILSDLGLEPIPDYDELLLDTYDELKKGERLLKRLNRPDIEMPDFDLTNKVSKSKQTKTKKKTNQMVTNN